MVFATVLLHGFSLAPLARLLGLASARQSGILIIGAGEFSLALAEKLKEAEVPVLVADPDWVGAASDASGRLATFYGEILSETAEHSIDFNPYGRLIAATRTMRITPSSARISGRSWVERACFSSRRRWMARTNDGRSTSRSAAERCSKRASPRGAALADVPRMAGKSFAADRSTLRGASAGAKRRRAAPGRCAPMAASRWSKSERCRKQGPGDRLFMLAPPDSSDGG